MAEITVWDGEAIELIESGEQADLSAGYFYRPLMESGSFNGVRYAGRMCDIVFNHLCLVDVGRVTNAVVGDSAMKRGANNMANPAMQKAYETLEKFLQEKLDDEDFQASMEHVGNLCRTARTGETGEDDDPDALAGDDPPDFPGKPRTGGSMVGDRGRVTPAAQRSFNKLFPTAKPMAHV